MRVEFVGQSSRDLDNVQADPSRLLNCYRESVGSAAVVKSTLGLSHVADLTGVFVRTLEAFEGSLYTLCGGRLIKVDQSGSATDIGAVDDGEFASISSNNGVLTVCSGGKYYTWDGSSLAEPAAGAFSSFGSVDYISGYTILTQSGGQMFQWSDLLDPATLPGVNFSSADGRDDAIVRGAAIGGAYYIFKERSHEIWYVTGAANASAFERQAGGVVDIGLKGANLLCKTPGGGAFFIGNDGRAYIVGGGPVSTTSVETAIAQCNPLSCVAWEDEGHTFVATTFADCPAWVYDISTGEWFERAQWPDFGPWQISATAKLGDEWFAGRNGGKILKMARSNDDAGIPLVRRMVSRAIDGDGGLFQVNEVELFARIGFAPGEVELRMSKDRGHTWGKARRIAWGIGEYGRRLIFRAFGSGHSFVVEITISNAAEVPINAVGRVA